MITRIIRKLTGSKHVKPEQNQQSKPNRQAGQAFDVPNYDAMNKARTAHLNWMQLPVANKSVLEIGCGIGRMSEYFEAQNCKLHCVDGRAENIEKLKELYPGRTAEVMDLETDQILNCGKHDIVFCYGLLYHLVDVLGLIKKAATVCSDMMIVETCVSPVESNVCYIVREDVDDVTQALHGLGSRPSPSYIVTCLHTAGFKYVYAPKEVPDHEQFRYTMVKDLGQWKERRLTRNIFIATYAPIESQTLVLMSKI